MSVGRRIVGCLNMALKPVGVVAQPSWETRWWSSARRFSFRGGEYPCFYHAYNCGWPPYVTERTVELALADAWLCAAENDVTEIGAVTSYYWPGRVSAIIDPFDPHPLVTRRDSMFEVDLTGRSVLAISTFEHIGTDDYCDSKERKTPVDALRKLFEECPSFLVTVPVGYSDVLDTFLSRPQDLPEDVSVGFLRRTAGPDWSEIVAFPPEGVRYGDEGLLAKFPETFIGRWANAIAVLERGSLLKPVAVGADESSSEGGPEFA